MKKYLLVLLLVLSLILFVACNKGEEKPEPSKEPTDKSTAEPVVTEPTEKPKDTKKPISKEDLGKPHPDAELLMGFDYSKNEKLDEDDYIILYPENYEESDDYIDHNNLWSAYSPNYYDYDFNKHNQYEYSVTFDIYHLTPDAPHVSYFVGARVPDERYASYPGGIWLAVNATKTSRVYLSGDNFLDAQGNLIDDWASRFFTIDMPVDFRSPRTVTVVDALDEIFFYISTDEEDHYLLLKVILDGGDLLIYDHNDELVFSGENAILDEPNFSSFIHRTLARTYKNSLKAY